MAGTGGTSSSLSGPAALCRFLDLGVGSLDAVAVTESRGWIEPVEVREVL